MDNELILYDRIEAIKTTINKYGQDRFYLSFSGGKDSTVTHYLLDMALPGNKIPRVFSNTGIEYNAIVKYVREISKLDDRFIVIYPRKNIRDTLEDVGYPFKSKDHSSKVRMWQSGSRAKSVVDYVESNDDFTCPAKLKYQFTDDFKLKVSEFCCREFKKNPFHDYEKVAKRRIAITGMRTSEGGERTKLNCLSFRNGRIRKFHPLVKVTDEWEDWFIQKYNIQLCELYYPPYNFKRTGCKGCPYNINLRKELEVLHNYLPNEEKQCEYIWKPVYDEYRRIGYRLKTKKGKRLF
jgi:3'-phosphoadenosine 5'-phosphosulfate sulfotransferase (PAPS reductase)/FAD synthetase